MAFGPYRKKTSQDWASRLGERTSFEAYVRLARDRALQRWHTTPSITMPFEQWYALVLKWPEEQRP